jgi:cytochrome c553
VACAPKAGLFDWVFPDWAFPGANAGPPKGFDTTQPLTVAGSARHFTEAELHNLALAADWRPDSHPPAPAIVLGGGRNGLNACGYCHLPGGEGRPENASLAGLPADYIRAQVAAFHSGARKGAKPDWVPTHLMTQEAVRADPADVAAAADYFSKLTFRSHVRVVEAAEVGRPQAKGFLFSATTGPREPLGQRIVEGPASFEGFERRDPQTAYTAFVPVGSLARGRALAESGGPAKNPCSSCHGVGLTGGEGLIGPPLAGRSPSYLFRQLYAFRRGGRSGGAAEQMRQETAKLSQVDLIALAAYAGSLKP